MSSYTMRLKCKTTKEMHTVFAIDDYFGNHKYGYRLPGGETVSRETLEQLYYPRGSDA